MKYPVEQRFNFWIVCVLIAALSFGVWQGSAGAFLFMLFGIISVLGLIDEAKGE